MWQGQISPSRFLIRQFATTQITLEMQKVLILGNCGAGKSTLARQLHQKTGLEPIHLDQQYWKPGWVEPSVDDWRAKVKLLVQKPAWIMDGNYGGTHDLRMPAADTIIFLDIPTRICLARVVKRVRKNFGKVREDMPEGCPERFSLGFFLYVARFRSRRRPQLFQKIEGYRHDKQIIVLRNQKEIAEFLGRAGRD